ncbi:MAG: polysaccharide deacetylase family protein [Deltaproteobacteria bacterium]|nr:polysaccharide deacetylase family protein [Deltaproteobacteria bacterium]
MLCSVSIDLDPISCYYRIHALGSSPRSLCDVILRRAVPRFLDVFSRHNIKATFFVVAEELEERAGKQAARALVREIVAAGHEVGNHSFSHPYELARLPRARVVEEIGRAHVLIGDATGTPPVGFRAPGYDISADMLDELCHLGYRYDSSIFPAPGYYLAKVGVMFALFALGKKSGAVLTDPRALVASPSPYRPDRSAPWRKGNAPIIELPIAVTPWLRLPAIGTSLLLAPPRIRAHWLEQMRRRPFFNLELHGIDLIDAERDGIPAELVARQPDLRVSLSSKQRAFEATLGRLMLEYEFVTLGEAAGGYGA